ncbi:S8 family serine peptidase [Actinomadura kijaniata]|uniref:S8 family peptidase n=1 Tax=Actinomadura kijaniata TaxID=46161 RepID=UPI002FE92E8D
MKRRRRGTAASLLGAALAAGALVAVPTGGAVAAPGAASPLPTGRSWKVTLLTGDVVTLRTVKGRRAPLVTTERARGRGARAFHTTIRPDGHVVVIPGDVARLVGKVLDPGLFDVTSLIEQGYDDARSRDLPLIVRRDGGVRARAALGGALTEGRELRSIGAVAARQPKGQAFRVGAALSARRAVGVRHVWLDRRVRATALPTVAAPRLDRNLTQIGAPAAWKAGATGNGVKVAVLDTGADTSHPDLKDRVAEARNFSEAKDAVDRHGHGTHVAATVAGTGRASGGARRGVAPEAGLLVGKVLDDQGYGSDSNVIAGMEWAAPRARIVNMSLGGGPTDGTDPLSKALDGLAARHGTLFVVAAGNDGGIGSVGAPGTADSALTVGAVDEADALAGFSSRGPRGGRFAAKPEIVAPGVDIVAARAKGTAMGEPVDARHTRASGTSMAAPHVAGAAALLAQKHPDWTFDRLKAALVGSADPIRGDAFERGSGRLDAGTAVTSPLVALQTAPHAGTSAHPKYPALTANVSWTSRAGAVRAALSVRVLGRDGKTVTGAAKLSTDRLAVPAGGTATATLTVTPGRLRPGLYTAEVVADGGGARTRTPVTFHVEPPSHTLTVVATPPPGTPVEELSTFANVVNLDDFALFAESIEPTTDGSTKIRVPRGRYSVLGTLDDWTGDVQGHAVAGTPEVVVDRDRTVVLDGASAERATVGVQGTRTETTMLGLSAERVTGQAMTGVGVYSTDLAKEPVYARLTGKASTGSLSATLSSRQVADGAVYDGIHPFTGAPRHVITPAERERMARVHQRFAAFDGDTSKGLTEKRYGLSPNGSLLGGFEAESRVPAGSTRTDHLTPGLWLDEAFPEAVNNGDWVDQLPVTERRPGTSVTYTWGRQPLRPGPVSGNGLTASACAPPPVTRAPGNLRVALVDLQARPDGFDCGYFGPGPQDSDHPFKRNLTLYEGDRKIGERAASFGDFTLPKRAGTYRLTYDNDVAGFIPVSVRTSTAWTFRSSPSQRKVPLLQVDYDLGLDLNGRPSGKPATFDVSRVEGENTRVRDLKVWASLDDGTTWKAVPATGKGNRFTAQLPVVSAGQALSLRVAATDDGGSGVDQTIIRAHRVR